MNVKFLYQNDFWINAVRQWSSKRWVFEIGSFDKLISLIFVIIIIYIYHLRNKLTCLLLEQQVATLFQPELNGCSPGWHIFTLNMQYFCTYFNLFRDCLFTTILSITFLIDYKRLNCLSLYNFVIYPPDLLIDWYRLSLVLQDAKKPIKDVWNGDVEVCVKETGVLLSLGQRVGPEVDYLSLAFLFFFLVDLGNVVDRHLVFYVFKDTSSLRIII